MSGSFEKLQTERERERMRSDAENMRLQAQLENLSRKLQKQTGEQLGEEAELDLVTQLRQAFPSDPIRRIGRGIKGADVVQDVMDGTNLAGRIVYESKNVASWQNAFLRQAAKYRTQYETPYVMIVSRVFPKKEKDFCVEDGIPIAKPRMAVALASVMRDGIVEIARLRLTEAGRDQKAELLLSYLVSDKFGTRFNAIADCAAALREQQRKERNWHENAWQAESSLHDRIDKNHREIDAQLKSVLTTRRPLAMVAKA